MKTTICTIIALFALTANTILAGEVKHSPLPIATKIADGTDVKTSPDVLICKLAPATPKDADFEDTSLSPQISIEQLAPRTPNESDFEDGNVYSENNPALK